MFSKRVGKKIIEARERCKITQVEMAKRLNISRQTYIDMEQGKTATKVEPLMRLSEITGQPLIWFVEEQMEDPKQYQTPALIELLALINELPKDLREAYIYNQFPLLNAIKRRQKNVISST